MIDLERALVDLAEHLDHPAGAGLDAAVLRRIGAGRHAPSHARRRVRVLIAAAAALVAITVAVVAVGPARHAIADWLGIGAVEVRRSATPLPTGSSARTVPGNPGAPGAPGDPAVARELATARRAVDFALATPRSSAAGALQGVAVDTRIRGGLVVLRYARFTLVEIATDPRGPTIGKVIGPATNVQPVTVGASEGVWIAGAHEIGYIDRAGNFARDTVRRSGPVLLWGGGGVTYRVEGFARLGDALAIARSLR